MKVIILLLLFSTTFFDSAKSKPKSGSSSDSGYNLGSGGKSVEGDTEYNEKDSKSGYTSKDEYYSPGTNSKELDSKSGYNSNEKEKTSTYNSKGGSKEAISKSGYDSFEKDSKSAYNLKDEYYNPGSNSKDIDSKSGYNSKGKERSSTYDSKLGSKEKNSKSAYDSYEKDSKSAYNLKNEYYNPGSNSKDVGSKSGYNSKEKDQKSTYDSKQGSKEKLSKSAYDSYEKDSKSAYNLKNEYYNPGSNSKDVGSKSGYNSKEKDQKSTYDSKGGSKEKISKSGYDSYEKDSKSAYNLKDEYYNPGSNSKALGSKSRYNSKEKDQKSTYDSKLGSKEKNSKLEYDSYEKDSKSTYNSKDEYYNPGSNSKDVDSKAGYNSKEKDQKSTYNSKQGSIEKDSKSGYQSKEKDSKSTYNSEEEYYNPDNYLKGSKEKISKSGSYSGYDSKETKSNNDYGSKENEYGSKEKSAYSKNDYNSKFGYDSKERDYKYEYDKGSYPSNDKYKYKSGYDYNKGYNSNIKYGYAGYGYNPGKVGSDMIKHELFFSSAPGHCKPICPCYMNGVTYDHGDRWHQEGDPCTVYECGNGFYKPVVQGVMYKGECKNVGTIWTEGCFTYTVKLIENTPFYRLLEGGCRDDEGNCWRVGDRFKKNCNTYECQIIGTCYTLSVITKGCAFDGECKEVNNYWHDGCTIFQCMDSNGQTGIGKLSNEIMYWPEGNYGLLKPKTGCPVDVEEEWSEGHRGHFGNLHNYVSFDFDAFGTYSEFVFIHYFCIRQQVNDPAIYPRYQTYWEPGKYCIFRKNETCPQDFKEGFIGMDDSDASSRLGSLEGSVPDGIYLIDTGFYFCCRDDGKIEVPIVLPKQRPFILFVDSTADGCQEVRGMKHTMEYFAFDDANEQSKPDMNGSIPMTKDGDNNTEIYFCHYKPMSCGCDDGEGNIVAVGEKVKKNCTWYACKDQGGIQVLAVDEGACMDSTGTCRKEGDVWMISSGETCYSKRCMRRDNGVKTYFEVKTDYRGCKDEEYCRPINYQSNRGCYTSVCTTRPGTSECYFRMSKAGCSDGNGKCVPLGKEFTKACMTYKCSSETSKCGMKFLRGGCKYDDGCHDVNAVWHHPSCHWLKCTMAKKDKSVTFSIDSVEQECRYKGNCYKAGFRVKEGCYTYQCALNPEKKQAVMNIVDGGCTYDGKCMGVNMTWTVGCSEYICRWYQKGLQHVFQSEINEMKCRYGTECVSRGDMRKHNCIDYECTVLTQNNQQYAQMKPLYYGCVDKNGKCLGINEEREEKCFLYRCEQKNENKLPELVSIGGGCEVNGVCKQENSVWTEYGTCIDYKCVRDDRGDKIYMVKKPVSVGCPHNGICHQHGEKWPSPDKDCFQVECEISKMPDNKFKRLLKTTPSGCIINGVCREFGYSSYEGCMEYKCEWDSLRQFATYRYTKGGCKEYTTSNCHDVGDEWTEPYGKTVCLKMTCQQNGNTFRNNVEYMCQDADGYCVKPGEYFESLGYNGKRHKNCYCKTTGNHVTAVCTASSNY